MSHPSSKVGFFSLTCLVIGNLIGTGIFVLPTLMGPLGGVGILGWVLTAGGVLSMALIFARLASKIPREGGIYAYTKEGLGDYLGYQVAWNYWVSVWTGNAAGLIAIPAYLSLLWPNLPQIPMAAFIICLFILWTLVVIQAFGIKQAALLQNIFTIIKMIPLILIPLSCLFFISSENYQWAPVGGEMDPLDAIMTAVLLSMWGFIGIESATIPAEEVVMPQKNIPRATMWGTFVTVGLYLAGLLVLTGALGPEGLQNSPSPYASAAGLIFEGIPGKMLMGIVTVFMIFSAIGCINGQMVVQAQMPYAASQDGLFPKIFSKGFYRGTPLVSQIISSLLITVLLWLSQTESFVHQYIFIVKISTLSMMISYICPLLASFVLFKKINAQQRVKNGLFAFVGIGFIVTIMAVTGKEAWLLELGLVGGTTILFLWKKIQKRTPKSR